MSWRRRIQMKTAAIFMASLLAVFALGFVGFSLYLTLLGFYLPNIAALLTAVIFVSVAIILLFVTKLVTKADKQALPPANRKLPEDVDEIENILHSIVDPTVGQWVKRNPMKSVIVTLIAGIVVGKDEGIQSAAKSAWRRFLDD